MKDAVKDGNSNYLITDSILDILYYTESCLEQMDKKPSQIWYLLSAGSGCRYGLYPAGYTDCEVSNGGPDDV